MPTYDAAEYLPGGQVNRKHEIEFHNGLAQMAYVQETVGTPWHGLGIPLTKGSSVEEWLSVTGLNRRIHKRIVKVNLSRNAEDGMMTIPKRFAVMRDDDHQFYGFVSDRYNVVQNEEIIRFFSEYVDAGGMELATAGSLKQGGVVWAMARIGKDFTLPGGDKVEGNMLLANSHDGSMPYMGCNTTTDVVCFNTLCIALNDALQIQKNGASKMFKMKHSKKITADVMRDAKEKMGLAVRQFDRFQDWAMGLANKTVKDPQHVFQFVAELVNPALLEQVVEVTTADRNKALADGGSLLDSMIAAHPFTTPKTLKEEDFNRAGKAILNAIVDSPGQALEARKGTWWGVLNGVTRYVDHEAGRGRDTALASAWFGEGNLLKQQAASLAVAYGGR